MILETKIKRLYLKLLVMPNRKNNFFDKYVRLQIVDLLCWFIYPEFRRRSRFIDLLARNKFVLISSLFFLFWTTGMFKLGKISGFYESDVQIVELKDSLDKQNDILYQTNELMYLKDSTISQLRDKMNSRAYYEEVIKRDCHLRHPDNLSKLPDKVFFTIIDEIERYQIPYTIFFRVIDHESGFKFIANAQGSGAFGYCQVIPSTFRSVSRKLGFTEHNEVNNIKAGAYVLRSNFDIYRRKGLSVRESWFHALVAYSGGNHDLAQSEMMYYVEKDFKP